MSSYAISQNYSFQSVLKGTGGALWALLSLLGLSLMVAAGLLAVVAVTAMVPPTFWAGLVITALFAYVTYPKGGQRG